MIKHCNIELLLLWTIMVTLSSLNRAFIVQSEITRITHNQRLQLDINDKLQIMMSHHPSFDDDDISQHEYSIISPDNTNDELSSETKLDENSSKVGSGSGYKRIEDWYEDHKRDNPEEHKALTHLKREKARWSRAFDSLNNGGGI